MGYLSLMDTEVLSQSLTVECNGLFILVLKKNFKKNIVSLICEYVYRTIP